MKTPIKAQGRQGQAGVALIEVLIALLLFSFGVLGLIGLQVRALTFSIDAEDRNRAALLANEIATTMWMTKSVTITTGAGTPWQNRVSDPSKDGLPNGSVDVAAVSANSADITITWTPPHRNTGDSSRLTTRVTITPP